LKNRPLSDWYVVAPLSNDPWETSAARPRAPWV